MQRAFKNSGRTEMNTRNATFTRSRGVMRGVVNTPVLHETAEHEKQKRDGGGKNRADVH